MSRIGWTKPGWLGLTRGWWVLYLGIIVVMATLVALDVKL